MPDILIPIFGMAFGCGIALLAIWTQYKRDRALIEKGLYQPEKPEPLGPPDWGFLSVGSIIAGVVLALVVSTVVFQIDKTTGIPGFIFLFIGIALLLVAFIARRKDTMLKNLREEELATSQKRKSYPQAT
jgi:peptidoglycan/LPS O-acetylase OafA/YrhL